MQQEISQDHCCSICLTLFYNPVSIRKCKHTFCGPCIEQATQYTNIKTCPLCRGVFVIEDLIPQVGLQKHIEENYPDELKQKAKSIRQRIPYKLRVGNTTKVLQTQSQNKYEWRLYVEPEQGQLPLSQYIEKVQFHLHPTFNPRVITFPATSKVQLKRIGWGTFRIDIKVFWKKQYGGYTDLYHDLSFSPKTEKILTCKLLANTE